MTAKPRRIADIEAFQVPPRWILIRVESEDGLVGWGESIVPKRARGVLGAISDLAGNIVGSEASRIEELWQRMRREGWCQPSSLLAAAAAGIEVALWDIKGQAAGLPVHEFLGGRVRESVPVYAWIGGDRPEDVVADATARREQGFSAVKMNATAELDYLDGHAKIDAAVARVAALRDAFGTELRIALDFHGRVHRAMAKALLAELEQFRLMWVEEPLGAGTDDALGILTGAARGIPIATGERLTSRWEFRRLLEDRVVDVLQPDVSLTGLFELEKIARMAEAYDVAVAPHCPNGPVSLAASLQVDACAGNVPIQEQSLGLHYNRGYAGLTPGEMGDYLTDPDPLTPHGGHLSVPDGPGLGIGIDEEVVRARQEPWQLAEPGWRHADGRLADW
jgi:galactonate dehydratase